MRRTIVAATVGASIAVGGLVGSALGGPGLAGAADLAGVSDEDGDGSGWVQDALDGLVDDGTITQDQADSVEDALADARPEGHGPGHRFLAHDLADIAEALGVEEDDVRAALEDGRTIAELAEEQGVEVSDVVDAIVSAQRERLDQAVADGDLTQEEADRILATSEERVTAFVEGEVPPMPDMSELPDMPHGDGERFGPPGMGHGGDEWHVPRGPGGEDERSRGSDDSGSDDSGSDDGDAGSGGASTEPAAVGV
jgi:polyhydroxyalkanoate synthesis regulator phasin